MLIYIATNLSDCRYVARLQARGAAKREMAQMRAARRRQILAEQLRREECKADEQKEELLVKRLMRQSQQEQRAATQLLQIKQNKEVIRENRANRQKQLEEERRREFSEALDREAQLAAAEKELYADQVCYRDNISTVITPALMLYVDQTAAGATQRTHAPER